LYDVIVGGIPSGDLTLADGFEVLVDQASPHIASVDPDKGYGGQTLVVRVFGKNTEFTLGVDQLVSFSMGFMGFFDADSTVIINDTIIDAYITIDLNAQLGYYDVIVENTTDGDLNLNDGFEITLPPTAPQLLYVTPNRAGLGDNLVVKIYSKNTDYLSDFPTVTFRMGGANTITPDSLIIISDTIIAATLSIQSSLATGWYMLMIDDAVNGTLMLQNALEILDVIPGDPQIVSVQPDSGEQGKIHNVLITCKSTAFNISSYFEVYLSMIGEQDINTDTVIVIDDTTLNVRFSLAGDATPGLWDVNIFSASDGLITQSQSFTIYKKSSDLNRKHGISDMELYPNPCRNKIRLSFELGKSTNVFVSILDSKGRLVSKEDYYCENNFDRFIDVEGNASGIYIMRIETQGFIETKSFLIH